MPGRPATAGPSTSPPRARASRRRTRGRRADSATGRAAGWCAGRAAAGARHPVDRPEDLLETRRRVVLPEPPEHLVDERLAALDARGRAGLAFACEPVPVAVDRRQPAAQVVGQQQVQRDDAQVRAERLHPPRHARARLGAQIARAHVGDRLDHLEPVAAGEQREQAAGVVGGGRQIALPRAPAGEQRRDRLGRPAGDGRRLAVPGCTRARATRTPGTGGRPRGRAHP